MLSRPFPRTLVVSILTATVLALTACTSPPPGSSATSGFSMRVVTDGLRNPFEVTWGPDDHLWVTEKVNGRVSRMSPTDGVSKTALEVADLYATPGAQDGLLGLALHPSLLTQDTNQYVYLAYTYNGGSGRTPEHRAKIVRYEYDRTRQELVSPTDLVTGLPAGVDHDSGRLVFGPDEKLYYTIGDQGRNQFDSYCRSIQSQTLPTSAQVQAGDWSAYQGKVLRLNLDGSIPSDNPTLAGVRSHVFSYGHRNPQGLVFASDGRLYSSEQGPKSDDEVNQIVAGGNYGWPRVAGFKDDKSYVYGEWGASTGVPCESLQFSDFEIPASVPQLKESAFDDPAFVPPIRTFSTVPDGYDFRDTDCRGSYFICWPTVAPSSLDYCDGAGVPGWGPSLLMPSLKDGAVYRIPLGADGTVAGEPEQLWRTVNRYRDIAIAPDGRTFYVVTDPFGLARGLDGKPTDILEHSGAILEFRYSGTPA